MITVDGFFEGPNKELDWHTVDDEFNEYANDLLKNVDDILFGRITYEGMLEYWPTPDAIKDDPIIAGHMNELPKIVFSKTLDSASWGKWNNARLIKDNLKDEVLGLKQQAGKDMVLMGSGTIVRMFTELGLIDEYRLAVNPVILGAGTPLFKDIKDRVNLKLLASKTFRSGVVVLYYEPTN